MYLRIESVQLKLPTLAIPDIISESMSYQSVKQYVAEILNIENSDSKPSFVNTLLLILILLNVATVSLETVSSLKQRFGLIFSEFERASIAVFSLEYVLRVWCCTSVETWSKPLSGRFRFSLTPIAMIDLVSIASFFLASIGLDLRSLRLLRVFRFSRALKLGRYTKALSLFTGIIFRKKNELIAIILFLLVAILVSATLLYYAEHEAQPEVFSSIPAALWWAIETLTTVGYGDMTPVTAIGKTLSGLIAVMGISVFTLPSGIISAALIEELRNKKLRNCPYCNGGATEQDTIDSSLASTAN